MVDRPLRRFVPLSIHRLAFVLALLCLSEGKGAPDLLVLNRGSNDIVHFSRGWDTCRYPEDARRFGTGVYARRVFPIPASRGKGSDLLYDTGDGPANVVYLEGTQEGRFREGEVLLGSHLLDALGGEDSQQGGLRVCVLNQEGDQAVLGKHLQVPLERQGVVDLERDSNGSSLLLHTDVTRLEARLRQIGRPVEERARLASPVGPLGAVKLLDVDRDGALDIVLAGETGVAVHLQGAAGGFQPAVVTGDVPFLYLHAGLHAGDFDGDGNADLLGDGRLLLGNGKGQFRRLEVSLRPHDVGDFDKDGFTDVVTGINNFLSFQVHRGAPGGRFEKAAEVVLGQPYLEELRVADVDGDGREDVVLARGGNLEIHPGKDGLAFGPPQVIAVRGEPVDFAQGNLNAEDESPEVVVMQRRPDRLKVLHWHYTRFDPPLFLDAPPEPTSLHLADFDGDGALDVSARGKEGRLLIHHGDGRGGFGRSTLQEALDPLLLAADLDGDGKADLLSSQASAGRLTVLRGRDPGFEVESSLPAGREPWHALAVDMDGDGLQDLAVANRLDSVIHLYRQAGGLRFEAPRVLLSGGGPSRLLLGDWDGEGPRDLLSVNAWTRDLSFFPGQPAGSSSFFGPERRLWGDGVEGAAWEDGRPFVALLREDSPSSLINLVFPDDLRLGAGGSSCSEFEDLGQDPIRVLAVDFRPPLFIRGDANRNDVVELGDAVSVLFRLVQGWSAPPLGDDLLDVDDSGRLEITDALRILNYLFLDGPPPAAPFPDWGVDATPDRLTPAKADWYEY